MRELSSLDKQIICRIIKLLDDYNLEELQVTRLLRKELNVFALEWDNSLKNISIYAPKENDKSDFKNIERNYFNISYFLYLIEDLENEGYIKLQSILSISENVDQRKLYDRDIYEKVGKNYIRKKGNGILYYLDVDYSKFNLDIVKLLDKYSNKIIFPLSNLKEFVNRGYITEEQKFRRDEIKLSRTSVASTKWAVWIAAVSTFLTAISTIKSCSDNNELSIKNSDMDRIEKIITAPKHIVFDGIELSHDTLKINQHLH